MQLIDQLRDHRRSYTRDMFVFQQDFLLCCHADPAETGLMNEFGERLKARARELGMTDSEVAASLGFSQSRYSNYLNQISEPDLATFVRIVRALGLSADEALGMAAPEPLDARVVLYRRIALAAGNMDEGMLQAIAEVFEAAASARRSTSAPDTATHANKKGPSLRRKPNKTDP